MRLNALSFYRLFATRVNLRLYKRMDFKIQPHRILALSFVDYLQNRQSRHTDSCYASLKFHVSTFAIHKFAVMIDQSCVNPLYGSRFRGSL